MRKLSLVIPVYNEEVIIEELYRRVKKVCEEIKEREGIDYEVIIVNDGSKDRTGELLEKLVEKDEKFVVIEFSRNFGHQIAITAGIDYSTGDVVVVMDGDLQDPPEFILDMLEMYKRGYDVVYAVRKKRKGEGIFKKLTAKLFYRFLKMITRLDIPLDTGDFRLMDRKVVEVLKEIREKHRFVRGLVSWVGFKQVGLEYERDPRYAGKTKYTLGKMLRLALDGITGFSFFPLRIATFLGTLGLILSIVGVFWVLYVKFFTGTAIKGWTSTMLVVLVLASIQLLILGIYGEYIGRIYEEVLNRPLYVIKRVIKSNRE